MKKYLALTGFILLISLALRIFQLSSAPLGFTWDEAALGYNAYSLLKTGRDEFGKFMPVIFRSFGDYKPGLYIYTALPPVAIFGLNEFSTRLPSAIFGTLLVGVIGLFSWKLFGKKASLVSIGLLAINPWAIHFSRGAWEANVSFFFTALASLLFIRKKYLLSALFFGLTFWTYQGAKLFTPLIILALIISFRLLIYKKFILPAILLSAFIFPLLLNFSSQSGRLVVLGVFNYVRPVAVVSNILRQDSLSAPDFIFNFFHAEIIDQTRGIVERFLNHYSPQFLFISGDWSNLRHTTPFTGYFYITEFITILLGLSFLLKNISPGVRFLLLWLIFSVLPSAFSRDIVSGVRSLPELFPLIIFSSIGMVRLLKRPLILVPLTLITLLLFIYYLDMYYVHASKYAAADWLYPYKPALESIKPKLNSVDRVVMTSSLGQPYIFVLFYYQIDPKYAQAQLSKLKSDSVDVSHIDSFDKFTFTKFYWPKERGEHATLYIGDQFELPETDLHQSNLTRLPDINYPNGSIAWKIVELK